ncbi:MAG TPA: glutathione S-transferase family protein [Hyphomicrobiaceae bacterium]|nr:glutathione S-transferase family protein [Hyphomicrobiaceae bacterium]
MTIQLYYAPGACSFVPHGLLEIAGATFEPRPVKLHKGEQATPEYLAINPRGQVPVLVVDGQPINQIVAIVTYINDAVAGGRFLPPEPLAKAKALQTLAWFNNTVHPTFTHVFMPQKFADDKAAQSAIRSTNIGKYREHLVEIDAMCATAEPWLGGAEIGPLDLYALTLMRWGGFAGIGPKSWAHLWPHANKVAQHPGVARAVERERLELDVKPIAS